MSGARRLITVVAIALAGVAAAAMAQPAAQSAGAATADPTVSGAASTESAELYLFNDSGRTQIPGNQVVTDNGRKVASLPRQTWVRLTVTPGVHLLKPDPPLWKQEVSLNVVSGARYFVVVAYRPERSWAAPLAGAPLILREITEEQAAPCCVT